MKSLFRFFKNYKKECVMGPLFKLLEASFELLVPLVVVKIIDNGIANQDVNYILRYCLVMVGLGIIGLVCSLTAQYFSAKAAVGFATEVKSALFKHIQSLSYSEIDQLGTSTMITRMTSDINQVQSGVNMTLRLFLRSPFIVFGAMIMAFTIDGKAALVFAVVIPLLSLVVYGIMIWTIPKYKMVQNGLDEVLGQTRSNLTGVRVIRAFGKEQQETDIFRKKNENYVRLQLMVGRVSALMNPLTFVIINLGIAWLVWRGGLQVESGKITQGQVVALVNYMSQILVELIKLANLIVTIIKALACAGRIENVFAMESSMKEGNYTGDNSLAKEQTKTDPAMNMTPCISFQHVYLTYQDAGDETLTDISFDVKPGEILGIIGGTGSGKSSVVNLVPRFYDATKGTVLVDGVDVKEYRFEALRGKIGVVPQKAVLFHGSIRKNMLWGNGSATDEDIMEALGIAQAKDFVEEKEGKLDYELTQGGKNLSGGQRQRLTIARALVRKPEILILDDSSSALDYATDAALRRSLREMDHPPTILIVSQRTSSIMYADQILVMDDGKMAGLGTHEQLLETCEVYQEIASSQGQEPVRK